MPRFPTTADLIADHGRLLLQQCRHCGHLTLFDCGGFVLCAVCDTDEQETRNLRTKLADG